MYIKFRSLSIRHHHLLQCRQSDEGDSDELEANSRYEPIPLCGKKADRNAEDRDETTTSDA